MILSEYEAKRGELEKEMEKLNAMESEKKMELSIKHQTELKKIASQIGQLKKKRADVQNQYQKDKSWWHAKFRQEKHDVTEKIHLLRLQYLTVNGVDCKETRQQNNG